MSKLGKHITSKLNGWSPRRCHKAWPALSKKKLLCPLEQIAGFLKSDNKVIKRFMLEGLSARSNPHLRDFHKFGDVEASTWCLCKVHGLRRNQRQKTGQSLYQWQFCTPGELHVSRYHTFAKCRSWVPCRARRRSSPAAGKNLCTLLYTQMEVNLPCNAQKPEHTFIREKCTLPAMLWTRNDAPMNVRLELQRGLKASVDIYHGHVWDIMWSTGTKTTRTWRPLGARPRKVQKPVKCHWVKFPFLLWYTEVKLESSHVRARRTDQTFPRDRPTHPAFPRNTDGFPLKAKARAPERAESPSKPGQEQICISCDLQHLKNVLLKSYPELSQWPTAWANIHYVQATTPFNIH